MVTVFASQGKRWGGGNIPRTSSRSRLLFFGTMEKLINDVTDGAKILISDLKRRKLIVESLDDDRHEFERVASCLEHKLNQPTILYLMTAQGCNFGCGYCPVPETAKNTETRCYLLRILLLA